MEVYVLWEYHETIYLPGIYHDEMMDHSTHDDFNLAPKAPGLVWVPQ